MKRLFLIMVLCTLSLSLWAAKVVLHGSFKALDQESQAKIEVDFSKAGIHGMSETNFADYEQDWTKDKDEIIGFFVSFMQRSLGNKPAISTAFNAPLTIYVKVLTINTQGDWICDVYLMSGNQELGRIQNVYAVGGHVGTKLNLIKDGAKHTGKQAGKLVKKAMKK